MSGLYTQLQEEYKQAMRDRNKITKEILSFVLAQLKNKQIDQQAELTDDEVIKVIKKEIKGRKEALVFIEKSGNTEEVAIEEEKIEIC